MSTQLKGRCQRSFVLRRVRPTSSCMHHPPLMNSSCPLLTSPFTFVCMSVFCSAYHLWKKACSVWLNLRVELASSIAIMLSRMYCTPPLSMML